MMTRTFTWGWLFALIVVVGVYFRFNAIDRKVFWLDETASATWVAGYTDHEAIVSIFTGQELTATQVASYQYLQPDRGPWRVLDPVTQEHPHHPPAYYLMLTFWARWVGDNVTALRLLSIFISLGVFPLAYLLARELFGSSLVAGVLVALLAVSPFQVHYAQEARQYSLWAVVILLASWLLLTAIKRQTLASWLLYGLSLLLGLFTHSLFAAIIAVHGCFILFHGVSLRHSVGLFQNTTLRRYSLVTAMALFVFTPWFMLIYGRRAELAAGLGWAGEEGSLAGLVWRWVHGYSTVFIDSSLYLPQYVTAVQDHILTSPVIWPIVLLIGPVMVLIGYALVYLLRQAPARVTAFILPLVMIPALSLMLPDLILGGARSAAPRYLLPSYLGIHLAVAYLFGTRLATSTVWKASTATVLAAGILSCYFMAPYDTWWTKSASFYIPEASRVINQASRPLVVNDDSGANFNNSLALARIVSPGVRFRLTPLPNMPTIPTDETEVFVYSPSPTLLQGLERQGYRVVDRYAGNLLLRISR